MKFVTAEIAATAIKSKNSVFVQGGAATHGKGTELHGGRFAQRKQVEEVLEEPLHRRLAGFLDHPPHAGGQVAVPELLRHAGVRQEP